MSSKLIHRILGKFGYKLVKKGSHKRSKYTNELSLYNTKTGKFYLPKHAPNDVVARAIINDEIFDKPIVDIAARFVKKGTTVLDVGSNFGQMAILFSDMTGPEGHVHAFDADDFVFSILEKNIAVNERKNIDAHFGAVHDVSNVTLYFPVQDFKRFDTYGSYGIDYKSNSSGRPVKSITIDSLKIDGNVAFMKVDVQGGDLMALRGARQTILKHRMPIIFEYEFLFEDELGLNFQEYVDFVSEINYKFDKVVNGNNYLILPR